MVRYGDAAGANGYFIDQAVRRAVSLLLDGNTVFLEETRVRSVPPWLTRQDDGLKGTVTRLPVREEMDPAINDQLIVEFYSRF